MERDLDNLTPEQREKVGNFMAITAINNTTHAIQFLEMCNYNLQQAVNTALETGGNIAPNQAKVQPPVQNNPPPVHNYAHMSHEELIEDGDNYDVYLPRGPLPEFTDEENEYYQYKLMQNEKAGIVKGVAKVVTGVAISFKTTTGDEFMKHAYKTLGKKNKLLINFQKIALQKTLENMKMEDSTPFLVYVHKNDHKLTPHILKEVIQDQEIAAFINGNFTSMGILTSNREMKIIMNFIEKEAIPCFIVLRKDKVGKICKIAQVELNCEGYLSKEVIFALLRESSENFKEAQNADKTFIQNFQSKLSRRKQVMDERINAPIHYGHFMEPVPPAPQNQGLTAHEIQRRQELERERALKREQERKFEQMKQQHLMAQQKEQEEERMKVEEEERIKREAEELARQHEEEQEKKRRKLSELPEEPEEGSEGSIKIAFRLPNGSRIMRNFNKEDIFELAYDFIHSQPDIGLEDPMAEIEILTSYPPKPLTETEKTFEEIFGEAKQELLIIKEL